MPHGPKLFLSVCGATLKHTQSHSIKCVQLCSNTHNWEADKDRMGHCKGEIFSHCQAKGTNAWLCQQKGAHPQCMQDDEKAHNNELPFGAQIHCAKFSAMRAFLSAIQSFWSFGGKAQFFHCIHSHQVLAWLSALRTWSGIFVTRNSKVSSKGSSSSSS